MSAKTQPNKVTKKDLDFLEEVLGIAANRVPLDPRELRSIRNWLHDLRWTKKGAIPQPQPPPPLPLIYTHEPFDDI